MPINFYLGKWRITWMEMWDADYYDMEVPAYFEIRKDRSGSFQFGLMQGELDGVPTMYPAGQRFEFTWEGSDEGEPMSGSGWLEADGADSLQGEIRIHRGDRSRFTVRKIVARHRKK